MKKKTKSLLVTGLLCMGFTLFTKYIFQVPEDIDDFLKGFGVVFIVSALFMHVRKKSRCPKSKISELKTL